MTVEPRVESVLATIREAIDRGPEKAVKSVSVLGVAPTSQHFAATQKSSTSQQDKGTLMRGAMREFRVSFDTSKPTGSSQETQLQIAELREKIRRTAEEAMASPPRREPYMPPPPPPPPRIEPRSDSAGFAGILSGRSEVREPPPPPPSNATRAPSYAYQAPRYRPEEIVAQEQSAYVEQTYDAYGHEAPSASDPYAAEQVWDDRPLQHGGQQQYAADPYYDDPYVEPAPPPPRRQAHTPAPRALISPRTERHARGSFEELAEVIMARAGGDRGLEDMTRDLLRGLLRNWLDENLPDLVEKMVREEIERVARGR